MKKLSLLILSTIFSIAVYAQSSAGSVLVTNYTNCTQYYYLMGGDDHCSCDTRFGSDLFSIAPMSSIYYPNTSSVPGLAGTPAIIFTAAEVFEGPEFCRPNSYMIGESGCGFSTSVIYNTVDLNCEFCIETVAGWQDGGSCTGMAELVFKP